MIRHAILIAIQYGLISSLLLAISDVANFFFCNKSHYSEQPFQIPFNFLRESGVFTGCSEVSFSF